MPSRVSLFLRRSIAPLPQVFVVVLLALVTALPAAAQGVTGVVVDPHDRPVAGAAVLLLRGATIVATARTEADGRFGPIAAAAGDYDLIASAPGLTARLRGVSVVATRPVEVRVPLALAAVEESVVVSAAQTDTPLSRVIDSVSVIDRAALDARQSESVVEALRALPALGIVASGSRGGVTSFFPRGGESDYTLVLADGVPLNAFGGSFDAAHLPTADLERVEVVRGPQSAIWGSGAIGGLVHLVRRQGGPLRAHASAERGGFGTTRLSTSAAGSAGRWTWGGALDGLRSDGDTRVWTSIGRAAANDDYRRLNGSAGIGWSDGPGRRVRIDLGVGRNERGFPGPYGSDPAGLYGGLDLVSRGENRTRSVGASALLGSARIRHQARVGWTSGTATFQSPFGASDDETRRISGRYQLDADVAAVGLSAGAELIDERADNTFITGRAFQPVPVERTLAGLFLEARLPLAARGTLHAGGRVERIARRALEGNPSPFGPRPAFDDDVVWSANPKIAAAWWLKTPEPGAAGPFARGWTRVRVAAGTGIKAPSAFEIAFTDNPTLRPERSRSVEVGLEQALEAGAFIADVTWFANAFDDLIVAVGTTLTGASRYRTDNIANARARGVELGMSWRPDQALKIRAAWTVLDTEILAVDGLPGRAPAPFSVGDPLVRRARHRASASVDWSSTRATAFLAVNGRGAMTDLEPNWGSSLYRNAGYAVVTLGGGVRVARHVEVFGRVTNLFDRTYEEALGFPAAGRAVFVGVRAARGR